MRRQSLAIVLALSPSAALASDGSRSVESTHPFEACMVDTALALEPSGRQVSVILADAERACLNARGELGNTAVGEIASKARLAVMQQRTNARNTLRRG